MSDNFIRVQTPDFVEFVTSIVDAVNLGYGKLELGNDEYPQNFGGLVYTCKLLQTEVKGIEIPVQVNVSVVQTGEDTAKVEITNPLLPKQEEKGAEEANKASGEPQKKSAGRPKGSSSNPRYDRGLKFNTGGNSNN